MQLEFDTIFCAYLNESPSKYYIGILGRVGGLRSCLFCLFRAGGGGGPEFRKTCLYNTCTLPKLSRVCLLGWKVSKTIIPTGKNLCGQISPLVIVPRQPINITTFQDIKVDDFDTMKFCYSKISFSPMNFILFSKDGHVLKHESNMIALGPCWLFSIWRNSHNHYKMTHMY